MRAAVLGVALLGLAWALPGAAPAHAAKAVPPAPYYYVLDEQGAISEAELRALQTLLVEHDRATGEQIVLAVFKSLDGEDLVAFTNRVFSEWKIGQRGKDNGVLLALYWNERQARIEVGYGLEPVLTDAQAKRVLDEALIPGLKADEPGRALSAAALEILRVLESPLLANGKAEEILRAGFARSSARQGSRGEGASWALWVLVGLALVISALFRLLAADAHYTGQGWHRPRRRTVFWGSGGGGWGGGGGGGFSGGGGRSGGGGASGSW